MFGVSLLALAALSVSCGKKSTTKASMAFPPVPVRAVKASVSDVPLDVSAIGTVEAITTVDVKSRVAGQILRVDFVQGQDVEKGQLLFEIDPEPLERQIAEIQADIGKDVALEQQARANVAKDQAVLAESRTASERAVELGKEGIFSKEQTEQAVSTAQANQAALEADQAAVESAAASLKADRARLAETQLQLTYTKITAPISGRAGAVAVQAGNLIKDNDAALVTILQMSPIYVSFGVPEQYLPEVRKYNSEHPLVVDATPEGGKAVTGTLCFIDNSVDSTTGTIKLKAEFPNTERTLWPGEFVTVTARLTLEHDRVLVPSQTVETGPQGKYVWVMNPSTDTVAIRPVQVLRNYHPPSSAEQAVIGSGLQPGEMVIVEGQLRLAPGSKVELLKGSSQLSDASAPGTAATS